MEKYGEENENPSGNVTDHAWYRFLFSKIQISFNH